MKYLQYFVFDKTGNDILDANVIPFKTEDEFKEGVEYAINAYKTNPDFKGLNLLLSCGNKVLFNSKEA